MMGEMNEWELVAAASFDRGQFKAGMNQLQAVEQKLRAQVTPVALPVLYYIFCGKLRWIE